jgi:hypothetical protein
MMADGAIDFGDLAEPVSQAAPAIDFGGLADPVGAAPTSPKKKRYIMGSGGDAGQFEGAGKSALGAVETAATMGSGLLATAAGGLSGLAVGAYDLAKNVATGEPHPLDKAVGAAVDTIDTFQQKGTYQPRTEMGAPITKVSSLPMEKASEYAGKGLEAAGSLVGPKTAAAGRTIGEAAIPVAATALGLRGVPKAAATIEAGASAAGKAATKAVQAGADAIAKAADYLKRVTPDEQVSGLAKEVQDRASGGAKEKEMVGGGAAMTEKARLRKERANSLGIPLMEAQAERDFDLSRETRELAKTPAGAPIRDIYAQQREKVLQKFDEFMDETGSEKTMAGDVGRAVVGPIESKLAAKKKVVEAEYKAARENGDMEEVVDAGPLLDHMAVNSADAVNSKMHEVAQAALKKSGVYEGSGQTKISVNDLEEVRKAIRRNADSPNDYRIANELVGVIDGVTENAGGPLYRKARASYAALKDEFENQGRVAKLLSTKPGTKDRSVAYEDVFDHTILNSSLDELQGVHDTLKGAGPEGAQAWQELKAATLRHIKQQATKSAVEDEAGNAIVSADKLNTTIKGLDQSGKLDFIFGKKGAEILRDINAISKDAFTSPPGTVNTSNTATVLAALMDAALSTHFGLPLPVATAAKYLVSHIKDAKVRARVKALVDGAAVDSKAVPLGESKTTPFGKFTNEDLAEMDRMALEAHDAEQRARPQEPMSDELRKRLRPQQGEEPQLGLDK